MAGIKWYRDQDAWRTFQQYLPPDYRITDDSAPEESYWRWGTHDVHLDRYRRPQSPVRVVLLHGVGTNGRQMMLVLGKQLADRGIETVAVDNLGYGLTEVGGTYTYADWVDLVVDFVAEERREDTRPIVLYGLSAGGMLTYHIAARAEVDGIVGMTFLDQRDQRTRDETAHDLLMSRIGVPAAALATRVGLGSLPMPMRWASKMSALANNRDAVRSALKDKTSAGNSVPLRFLDSYMNYAPAVEAGAFDRCPVLLTQPAADRWSPLHLSGPLMRALRVPHEVVFLDGAGHYPLEQPGLGQLTDAVEMFVRRTAEC